MATPTIPVQDDFGNIIGEDTTEIDSVLTFWHPSVIDQATGEIKVLRIRSGANSIKWSYQLNTGETPTIGGSVVQVLSCFAGPMTIEGMTAGLQTGDNLEVKPGWERFTPVDEMQEIVDWFLEYMSVAGLENRNQRAIHFSYPARAWEFLILVTSLNGFKVSNKEIAVPWSITAEIVNDTALDYWQATTMNQFTDSLTSRKLLQTAITPGREFGSNPFVNPALNYPGTALTQRLSDNFSALVAAHTGGDWMTWGFSALGDNTNLPEPYEVYFRDFKGWYIGGEEPTTDYGGPPPERTTSSSGGGTGGSSTDGSGGSGVGDPATVDDWILDVLKIVIGKDNQPSQEVLCFMKAWYSWENGNVSRVRNGEVQFAKFNWLNTSYEGRPGSYLAFTTTGSMGAGIAGYNTYEAGIAGTAGFILNGNYPAIVSGLRTGNILSTPGVVDNLNTWGTGHSGSIFEKTRACVAANPSPPVPPVVTGNRAKMLDDIHRFIQNGVLRFDHSNDLEGMRGDGVVIRMDGEAVRISDSVLASMVYICQNWHMRVSSLIGTHSRLVSGSSRQSRHWTGDAYDIGGVSRFGKSESHLASSGSASVCIEFMQYMKASSGAAHPDQMICNGTGVYNDTIQALQLDNGSPRGGVWVSDHLDHIHLGY